MTIRTPVDKTHIRNHLAYSGWKYALLAVLSIFCWSLIYTQTAYRSPQDKRIDVYIKSSTVSTEMADKFMEPIWKSTVPSMEVVSSVSLLNSSDYSAVMQLQVYLAAGEGDIYILPAQDYRTYAASETFLQLDDLIASGVINVDGINLDGASVMVVDDYDDEGSPIYTGEKGVFGIPMDTLYAFMDGMQLDNRGMYMCIAANNQNDENVIPFFNALLQAGRGEQPEWLTESE